MGTDLPACVNCGACCAQTDADAIPVFDVDLARMDAHAKGFVGHGRTYRAMRIENGRCAALRIDAGAGAFVCAIYGQRPDACRAFERGGRACHDARRRLPWISMRRATSTAS